MRKDEKESPSYHLDIVLEGAAFRPLSMFSDFPLSRFGLPWVLDLLSRSAFWEDEPSVDTPFSEFWIIWSDPLDFSDESPSEI